MPARREIRLLLEHPEDDDAAEVGQLRLQVPPRYDEHADSPLLLDERESPERDEGLAPVQLLEGAEYIYELEGARWATDDGDGVSMVELQPSELFDPDTRTNERGRLRPGMHTGLLPLSVWVDGRMVGRAQVEVRSRKLGYREHYRWMLDDIASDMAEVVMQRFAPSEQRFRLDESLGAATLYQRFAFLRALIESEVFDGAVQRILRRPYRTWVSQEETRRPGQGVPSRSDVIRQLAGPGPRTDAGRLQASLGLASVPRTLRVARPVETRDNIPNRFVRFALERWRGVVARIHELLLAEKATGPVERGRRECRALLDRLDDVLARELFRSCGRLVSFPAANQVLQKREGYRDVFRAYVQFEAAARLSWTGGEDVYGAGQRDVARLYEYWVYLTLGQEVSELCDEPFDFGDLIEPSEGGLELRLKKGKRRILSGGLRRLGRGLDVELWFNRTFSAIGDSPESWTKVMRPDCSLRIRGSDDDGAFFHQEVWLHFDAKYRVDRIEEALGGEPDDPESEQEMLEQEEEAEVEGRATRADLLKMHAYRDAIRRSSGAYVIYPGFGRDQPVRYPRYHEILPGLGAFPLRPTSGGPSQGAFSLRRFIDEVLDQVSLQTSQHERARYWEEESYRDKEKSVSETLAARFLQQPPADTPVLLGYVKSEAHYEWIRREGLYNLRADDRTGSVDVDSDALGGRYALLYGRSTSVPELWAVTGEPRLLSRDDMEDLDYPDPGGDLYFCLPVGPRRDYRPIEEASSEELVEFHAEMGGGRRGVPLVVNWVDVVDAVVRKG